MTMQRLPGSNSLPYPITFMHHRIQMSGASGGLSALATVGTADAAGEKIAFVGHVYWEGAPAAAKTMDSTSKIHFRTGTVTFANAGTNLRIGLQDVSSSTGPPIQPDGTFDVYADVAGNSGLITSSDDNVAKSITLSTSGSKSVTHGDLIAIVFDMTARGGSDSLILCGIPSSVTNQYLPICLNYVTSWPSLSGNTFSPIVMLESSDGTLGTLKGAGYWNTGSAYTYASSSNPDERGLVFQVPFACRVNSVFLSTSNTAAAADGTIKLYSTPLGTPTELASLALLGEQTSNDANERINEYMLSSEVSLAANTDYCVSYVATGSSNVILGYAAMVDPNHRTLNGLTSCRGGYRTDGSGAFTEDTTNIPIMAVGICAIDDGTGIGRATFGIGV